MADMQVRHFEITPLRPHTYVHDRRNCNGWRRVGSPVSPAGPA